MTYSRVYLVLESISERPKMHTAIHRIIKMLDTVKSADNSWLEHNHDWVQVAFPLFVPSAINPDAPLLTHELVHQIKANPEVVDAICVGVARMIKYFNTSSHWVKAYDHNMLRVTRILHSISYTLGCGQSQCFLRQILRRCEDLEFTPTDTTLRYWSCAANGLNYAELSSPE